MEYLPQLVGNNLRDALAEGSNLISALMPEDIVGETVVGNGSPSFQKFLDTTINSREETPMKKLFSAAIAIADEKGVLPKGMDAQTAESIVSIADESLGRLKVAYQIATGQLDLNEAVDALVDRAAARVTVFLDRAIDVGLPMLAEKACIAVAHVFPPAIALVPYVRIGSRLLAPKVKSYVHTGINKLTDVAKSHCRYIANKSLAVIKKVSSKMKRILIFA